MTAKAQSGFFERVRFRGNPVANPESIVVSGNTRFTVLTPRLLRLEWSEKGTFEDRATYAFPTRYAPTPSYSTRRAGEGLCIDTDALSLCFQKTGNQFTADNLSIVFELDGQQQRWRPGDHAEANLRGTRRTLDRCEGDAALEQGILSRAGWSLFDDSRSVLFDPRDGWVVPRPEHQVQDWYFFGYGHDYKGALSEYTRFGGRIPLVPRYVLGAWWSRYWAYTDQDLQDLICQFEAHGLSLDVLVVDMDWHTPHSWTGYTWNRELFPDPPAFLRWVHDKGLRVSLNLHPAEGVQTFEEIYPRFAEALGLDPETGEDIPFQITDKEFAKAYFELLHHPMEDDGVDFWWVDWQQGESCEMEGLDPLPWLNHLHFSDSTRRGSRPMIYSRWGGLGGHRYQTGFSGDTWVGWPALQFQPFFTATASNVCYGWWGHDIGGHMGGPTEPELYARWVQFGALSPSLRLHATKDPLAERRPWKYPEEVYRAAKAAFRWRYSLIPYLYSMARVAHDTGVSLCRPMYYEHPGEGAAYTARYQYYFGDQMIAAPIVHPADPDTGLAATDVWVPRGTWIEYTTKETFTGPGWFRLLGDLDRVPMLMRSGAILPLAPPFENPSADHMALGTTDAIPHDRLVVSVFPGEAGSFRLYEDDGLSPAYESGEYEWTEITTRTDSPDTWLVQIGPVEGHCQALPRRRGYEVRLEGSRRPMRITLNGRETEDWYYDKSSLRTTVHVPPQLKSTCVSLVAVAEGEISALGEAHNQQVLYADLRRLLGERFSAKPDTASRLDAVLQSAAPGQEDAIARLGGPFVRFLEFTAPEEARQRLGRVIVGAPRLPDAPYNLRVDWTLDRGGKTKTLTTRFDGATGSHILDAPFAWDGEVAAMRWIAEVQINWQGKTLRQAHHSSLLFPSIYAWRAVIYDRAQGPLRPEQVMDAEGRINEDLAWLAYSQQPEDLTNVNQPHGLDFRATHWQRLRAGEPLAAYLATTATCPGDQEVKLNFHTAGKVEIWANGQPVKEIPVQQEDWPPRLRNARRTEVIHLRAGQNTLVVHTRPSDGKIPRWYFGGALTTPGSDLMTHLSFSSQPATLP